MSTSEDILKPLNEVSVSIPNSIKSVKIQTILDPRKHSKEINEFKSIPGEIDTKSLKSISESIFIPVAIRIVYDSKYIYKPTGIKVSFFVWDSLRTARGNSTSKQIEKNISVFYDNICERVKTLSKAEDGFSFERLKTYLLAEKKSTFSEFWRDYISEKKGKTASSYNDAYKSIHRYLVVESIRFDDVNVDMVKGWLKDMQNRGISNTTIGIYSRALKASINDAISKGLLREGQNPFQKNAIKIPRGVSRKYHFIDIDVISKINSFDSKNMDWNKSKDMFIFSYLAGGANLADIASLRWDEYYYNSGESEFKFIRKKTEDKVSDSEILIPISKDIRVILQRWASIPQLGELVFPFLLNGATSDKDIQRRIEQENQNIRKRLHKICRDLELPQKLSPTWARHSYKTNAEHLGIPSKYIEMAMGHTLGGVEKNYMGLFPKEDRMEYTNMLLKHNRSKDDILREIHKLEQEIIKLKNELDG